MALGALVPGVPASILAFALGSIVDVGAGVSAAIGVAVAVGGFAVQALALGWARKVSMTATQAVASITVAYAASARTGTSRPETLTAPVT